MDLSYPIGRFKFEGPLSDDLRRDFIDLIEQTPGRLRRAVEGLSAEQLDTPYRPGGWTVRQVVHHLPDSHLNSYVRFKLALTEEEPAIRLYFEDRWAELEDGRTGPVEVSLALLESLHQRWVILLKAMSASDYQRAFKHPELGLVSLEKNLSLYAWHGQHHIAQINSLSERMGWFD